MVTTFYNETIPECKNLKKGELFPWLVELELKSVGKSRTFSGELISLRSLITCCVCIEPLNPEVKTMHRIISADLETISAKTVDGADNKTFQVRYALQTVAEATCTTENERKKEDYAYVRPDMTFIAVIILDMSFFWEKTFNFPRMPYLSSQELIADTIRDIRNSSNADCWCQSQLYIPLSKDFSSRNVITVIHMNDLSFSANRNVDNESTVITGMVTSSVNNTMNLGSPLVCNGTVLGVLTAHLLLESEQQMMFIRLDFASAFMTEFLLLERYFQKENNIVAQNLSPYQLPSVCASFIYFHLLKYYF